ncbi:DUF6517 family protein [Haladaptatus sp. ZSTT2]|uniref:DUF6517 family protein n=1 Tax=Haladaptatus sp. ZSTT2 TaxID=3120515 RepID=UPI00300F15E1
MISRRRALALVSMGAVGSLSGCIGFLTGSEALQFSAETATVASASLEETDYEKAPDSSGEQTVERSFSVADQERQVEVTNHIQEYKRSVNLGVLGEQELARFIVLSTPKVDIAGKTFNPVGEWSAKEFVMQIQSAYKGLSDIQQEGERSVSMLGESRTVTKFSARAEVANGEEVDVFIHVTEAVGDGDDYVIGIGVYPQQIDGEQARVDELIAGIEH